tara:strand:+ start:11991 stop:14729 length:2739 start_codon:yes stop_codon:yes gene_type:complete
VSLKSAVVGILRVGAAVGALAVGDPFLAAAVLFSGNYLANLLAGQGGENRGQASLSSKQNSQELNVSAPEAALPVVYGYAKVGHAGVDIRLDGADNNSLAVVGAICVASDAGGGISAIEKVWFDDVLAIDGATFEGEPRTTNVQSPWSGTYGSGGTVQYGAHAGADAQVVDAQLNTKFSDWGATDKGVGIAYMALWLYYDADRWPFGIPQVTYKIKGNLCYDVRDTTTAWTDNPVLHIYDWMTSTKYGMRIPTASMDSTSFIAAANYADELVTDPEGGTQKRFTGGGAYSTSEDPHAVLEQLKSGCRAQITRIGGKYVIHIRQVQSAETFELTEDNIVGEFEFWRGGVGQVPNQMAAVYVDADRLYKADTVIWPAPGAANSFLTADNSYLNQHQIELPHTDQRYRAQQIAMTVLKETRADVGIALTANREALKLQQGDVVKVTHSTPAWTDKDFWVIGVGITPDHNVRLLLREYDSTAYTIDAQDTTDSPPGTDLPDPHTMATPSGVSSTADATTVLATQDGLNVPRIKLAWTAHTDPFLSHYEHRFKVTADSDYTLLPDSDKDEIFQFIWPVTDGVGYTCEVRAVNTAGVKSGWATSTVTVATTATVRNVTFRQASAPTALNVGDLWYDTDDGKLYRWDGSDWDEEVGGPGTHIPSVSADWSRTSSATATMLLTLEDRWKAVTAIAWSARQGSQSGDSFSAYSTTWGGGADSGTPGTNTTLVRDKDVTVDVGEETIFRYKITYTDEDGDAQVILGTVSSSNIDEEAGIVQYLGFGNVQHSGQPANSEVSHNLFASLTGLTSRELVLNFQLPVGVKITDWSAVMYRDSTSDVASIKLQKFPAAGGAGTTLGSLQTHASTGYVTLSDSGPDYTVVAGDQFVFLMTLQNNTAIEQARFLNASITYVRHTHAENL